MDPTDSASLAFEQNSDSSSPCLAFSPSLEAYLSRYEGYDQGDLAPVLEQLHLLRLKRVAESRPALKANVLRVLIPAVKNGFNVALYKSLYEAYGNIIEQPFDAAWCETADRSGAAAVSRLENELTSARSAQNKETIRLALLNLGDAHIRRGDHAAARIMYERTRDYRSTPAQSEDTYVRLFLVGLCSGEVRAILGFVNDATVTSDAPPSRTALVASLCLLGSSDFAAVANALLALRIDDILAVPGLVSAVDVAVYGALFALASLPRSQLGTYISSNQPFRALLDTAPELLNLINHFTSFKYRECFEICARLRQEAGADLILRDRHLDAVVSAIEDRLLLQYLTPYSSADLNRMASACGMSTHQLISRLAPLIVSGKLSGRIDAVDFTFSHELPDEEAQLISKLNRTTYGFLQAAQRTMLRLSVIEHDFTQGAQLSGAKPRVPRPDLDSYWENASS
jgi:COP9 signalosome complex subunit 1